MLEIKQARELFEDYLSNLNTSIELIDVIIPTIKTFDGKVYDRQRFDYAINRAIKKHNKDIVVYFHSNIQRVMAFFWLNYPKPTCVTEFDDIYLLHDHANGDEYNIKYFVYDLHDKKRLNSSMLIEALEESKEDITRDIVTLKNAYENIDDYKKEADDLRNRLFGLQCKVPYVIRALFGIKTLDNN